MLRKDKRSPIKIPFDMMKRRDGLPAPIEARGLSPTVDPRTERGGSCSQLCAIEFLVILAPGSGSITPHEANAMGNLGSERAGGVLGF